MPKGLTKLLIFIIIIFITACAHRPPQTIVETTINNKTYKTTVPADREVVLVPRGFTRCVVIPASWHNGAWIAPHKVCEYQSQNRQKPTWISGYWHCTSYNAQNQCSYWAWTPSHWNNSIVRE